MRLAQHSFGLALGSLAAAASLTLLAGQLQARECSSDADCPKSYSCESSEQTACPAIACIQEPCEISCTTETVSECVPGPCSSDADCDAGMVCVSETQRECEDQACSPEADCPETEPVCVDKTVYACVPQYLAQCQTNADCGAGFACVEEEQCQCSGSSGGISEPDPGAGGAASSWSSSGTEGVGGASSSGGSDEPVPAGEPAPVPVDEPMPLVEDCSCAGTGTFVCELIERECSSAADCPDGFSCEDNPVGGVCSGGTGMETVCSEPDPAKVCIPPYTDLLGAVGSMRSSDSGGLANSTGESGLSLDGSYERVEASGDDTTQDSSGCQLSAAGAGSTGSGAMALLLALGLVRRRRD